jgi:hypothetical protein
MTLKTIGSALLLFAIFASRGEVSCAGADPPVAPHTATEPSNDSQPSAVARRVFEGSPFWWKHRATVEVPTRDFGFLASVKHALEVAMHFVGQIVSRVLRFFSGLLPDWTPALGAGAGLGSRLVWILTAVAVGVIAWVTYRVVRRRRFAAANVAVDAIQEPERLPDALLLLARAKAALATGDTYEALRLGFLAILAGLEDRGIVRYDAARTNSEYLRDLRRQPALADDFRRVAFPVDRALYGKIRPEVIDVEQAFAFCQGLLVAPMAQPIADAARMAST